MVASHGSVGCLVCLESAHGPARLYDTFPGVTGLHRLVGFLRSDQLCLVIDSRADFRRVLVEQGTTGWIDIEYLRSA